MSRRPQTEEETRILSVYEERARLRDYSLSSEGELFMQQDRERAVLRRLKKRGLAPLDSLKILEVGCGTGTWIRDFIRWGARPESISGVDLIQSRIDQARQTCPKDVKLSLASADLLPLESCSQDLVLQSTVFTSVLDMKVKHAIASEMLRVLKPDGTILWYDFFWNNPSNQNVRGVGLKEIRRLFPETRIEHERITLAPPLVRPLARMSWTLCAIVNLVPFLKTHLLITIQKLSRAPQSGDSPAG
jgi:SAM-dependent methyltransferase